MQTTNIHLPHVSSAMEVIRQDNQNPSPSKPGHGRGRGREKGIALDHWGGDNNLKPCSQD